jgi:hypothetical protein
VCWLPEFHLCRHRVLIDVELLFTQIGRLGAEGYLSRVLQLRREHQEIRLYGTVRRGGLATTVPPVVPEM